MDETAYFEKAKSLCRKFTREAFDQIRMRSRSFYIEKIYSSNNGTATGIIVFESLEPMVVNEQKIGDLMNRKLREGIQLLLEQINPTKPELPIARRAGF